MSDNKGFISVFDLDFKQVDIPEEQAGSLKSEYGHKADKICSLSSGEKIIVAVGDEKGYITVFDGQSMTKLGYFAAHKSGSKSLQIT